MATHRKTSTPVERKRRSHWRTRDRFTVTLLVGLVLYVTGYGMVALYHHAVTPSACQSQADKNYDTYGISQTYTYGDDRSAYVHDMCD
jgi:type II secretory pathway component PulL